MQLQVARPKLLQLECARGIACIAVVLHHQSLAFLPQLKDGVLDGGLKFTPLYTLFNGGAAVKFFFVLSGFVLALGIYRNPSGWKLFGSALKRLPRLALPCAVSTLIGFLILKAGSTYHEQASVISGSDWLFAFAGAQPPTLHDRAISTAMRQMLSVFFVSSDTLLNSNLWTMQDEFLGSMVVFATTSLYCGVTSPRWRSPVMHVAHAALTLVCAIVHPAFVQFLTGSWLAYAYFCRRDKFVLSKWTSIGIVVFGLLLFSGTARWLPATAGSLLIIVALVESAFFTKLMSGRIGLILGTVSFPLYLVHTLVILSLTSFVYVSLAHAGLSTVPRNVVAVTVTLAVSFILAIPFIYLEAWWVPLLNRVVPRIIALVLGAGSRPSAPASMRMAQVSATTGFSVGDAGVGSISGSRASEP